MVDEDADAPGGAGAEAADLVGEVVDPVEQFDDDALVAQVVAPDLLEQLGVVLALDPDAAGAGDPCPAPLGGDRARGGQRSPAAARAGSIGRRGGDGQGGDPPLDEEAPDLQGEAVQGAAAVLELHLALAPGGDGADDPAGTVLDDEAASHRGARRGPPLALEIDRTRHDAVTHPADRTDTPRPPPRTHPSPGGRSVAGRLGGDAERLQYTLGDEPVPPVVGVEPVSGDHAPQLRQHADLGHQHPALGCGGP